MDRTWLAAAALLALGGCGGSSSPNDATTRPDGTPDRSAAASYEPAEPAAIATAAAAAAADTAPARGSLPDGEYACYGSGSTVLAGLGFKVSGGSYTDLDGGNPGTVAIQGTDVVFTGGIHGDQNGRDFTGKGFRLGRMAVCEKW